jgi:hypothetical protein
MSGWRNTRWGLARKFFFINGLVARGLTRRKMVDRGGYGD